MLYEIRTIHKYKKLFLLFLCQYTQLVKDVEFIPFLLFFCYSDICSRASGINYHCIFNSGEYHLL